MKIRPLPVALAPMLVVSALLFDCATLEPLAASTCGNGVVDAAEDCDTFPDGPTARCGGPADGEAACRLRCGRQPAGEVLACPEGWGCSVKGVCREPTGQFERSVASVSAGMTTLAAGDFDGDGRKDVLGTGPRSLNNASRVRVHYFDDLGGLAQAVSLPSQLISPTVLDFDRNGRDDIAFGLPAVSAPGGLGVVSGLPDRRFLSILFPSVTLADTEAVPVAIRPTTNLPLPNGTASAVLLFARSPAGAALTSIEAELGGARLARAMPVGPEALRGRPLAGRLFDADPTSGCSEVVAAVETGAGPRVYVVSPCAVTGDTSRTHWESSKAKGFDEYVVPQALGPKGVLLVDANRDGHLDVFVDTTAGAFVAFGDGTKLGPFFSAGFQTTAMPLAAADLNLDGVVDLVFDNFVVLSNPSAGDAGAVDAGTAYDVTVLESSGVWSEVLVGNFNGDRYPDLVAARAGSPDLRLYAGGPFGIFNPFTVTTDSVVERIAKGDFDGDHVDDIAIAGPGAVAGSSDLSIAYGRAFGGPEPAQLIGRVAKPDGLLAIASDSGALDGLGAYVYGAALPTQLRPTAVTIIVGSGDRQALAPLFFLESNRDTQARPPVADLTNRLQRFWFPVALSAGPFRRSDFADVFSLALGVTINTRTGEFRTEVAAGAWEASGDPSAPGGLSPPRESAVIDKARQLLEPVTLAVNVVTASGDLDNAPDHLDEVVTLTNDTTGMTALVEIAHIGGAAVAPLPLSNRRVYPGAPLGLVDLDGDGFRDLVCVLGDASTAQVFALLNDGRGSFLPTPIAVSLPTVGGAFAPARAFAAITVGGAPVMAAGRLSRALAVVSPRGLALAVLRGDKTGFDVQDLSARLGDRGPSSATGITAGDFNGDGVEDLAVADAGSIRLLLQVPARTR